MADIIQAIEKELLALLKSDQHNWTQIYRLMQRVEDEELYADSGFQSYTAWVNSLADRSKVHVSILWRRKKAGKFYSNYQKRAAERGIIVPSLEEAGVSSDDLSLVEKIAGGVDTVQDNLLKRVLNKDMTRRDLKEAWSVVKAEREKKGLKITKTSRHDTEVIEDQVESNGIDAYKIIRALSSNRNWFPGAAEANKYRLFPEFTVQTGSAHHGRRIDALVAVLDGFALNLIGIEIKVDKADLLNDHKMSEYTDFVDQFYIAVPDDKEMIAAAQSVRLADWGIVVINDRGDVKEVQTASKLEAVMRNDTLATLVSKIL